VRPDPADVLESVRTSCAEVARRARLVHVVAERLEPYAAELAVDELGRPGTDAEWAVPAGRPEEEAAGRVLALVTVNFGSGWHPVVRKRPGLSGARTMAAGLGRWLDAQPPSAERLAALDVDEAHEIFDQPHDDGPVDELMRRFTTALDDLGRLVVERHDGSFSSLVASADRSAARLVETLSAMPSFRDVARYDELEVPLYKRAQLAAADLHRAFSGQGLGRFDDLDRLTAFADNLVPHVLRLDHVLEYDDALLARIDAGELLVAGSPEEVEIRAMGVHAVELLGEVLAAQGVAVPPWRLDQVLWTRGGGARYKAVPRHRARSPYY
jgi:hypothetical protein